MPELDGYEATRQIRLAEPCRHTPIIAMTANTLEGDSEKCLAAGMNDYLDKPILLQALAAVLLKWTAPVDPASLTWLEQKDPSRELLRSVIQQYLDDAPVHLSALREGVANQDAQAVRGQAHALKGSSANFNAKGLQDLCARLEALARTGSLGRGRISACR